MSKHKHKKREERRQNEENLNQYNQGQNNPNQYMQNGMNYNQANNNPINPLIAAIGQSLFGNSMGGNASNNINGNGMQGNNQVNTNGMQNNAMPNGNQPGNNNFANNNSMNNNPLSTLFQGAMNNPIFQLLSNIDLNLLYKLFLGGNANNLTNNNNTNANNNSSSNMNPFSTETSSTQNDGFSETEEEPVEVFDSNDSSNQASNTGFSSNMLGQTLSELLKNLDERGVDELVKSVDEDKVNIIMKGLGFDQNSPNTRVEQHTYTDENNGVFIKTATISGMATYSDNSRVSINNNNYFATDIIELIQDIMDPKNMLLLDEVMKVRNRILGKNQETIINEELINEVEFSEKNEEVKEEKDTLESIIIPEETLGQEESGSMEILEPVKEVHEETIEDSIIKESLERELEDITENHIEEDVLDPFAIEEVAQCEREEENKEVLSENPVIIE